MVTQPWDAPWAGTLVDELSEYVALLSPDGAILEANQSLLRNCRLDRSKIQGRLFWELRWWQVCRDTHKKLRRAIREASGGRQVRYEADVCNPAKEKSQLTLDLSIRPLRDSDGQIVRLLLEARDITERKQAEREVERKTEERRVLYEQLKEFDQLKTQFFANVSHELRTPLTLILGPVRNWLSNKSLSQKQRRELQIVERNAGLLLKRVNNLLDLSKLEAEAMVLSYQECDFACVARFVASHFEGLAEERDIDFVIETPDQLPGQVDPEKIQRVLLNLLSNAFKFTPDGGTIVFSLHQTPEGAVFSVQDSGIGISPQQRTRIFERFRQVDCGVNRNVGGTGLGLSIVKEFITLHRGKVRVDEAPGGGAVFFVEVPLRAPRDVKVTPANRHSVTATDLGKTTIEELRTYRRPRSRRLPVCQADAPLILVIEDNPDMNSFLAETISEEYRVATAFDGHEGLQKALQLRPDLILTDMMMPRMSGEEFVREVRCRPEMEGVPIVLLTARADNNLHVKLLNEGVMSYLNKPFSAEELRAKVRRLITEHRRSQASLRKAYSLLHAVTEGIGDAVFVKDTKGRYLMINSAGARNMNRQKDKILGQTDDKFFTPEVVRTIREIDQAVIATGEPHSWEQERIIDGKKQLFHITKLPHRDESGKISGVMGIARDITAPKKAESELREAKELAEAANKAKDRFLAILSHELRTPLTPVLATVNYMATRDNLPAEFREEMTMIRRNVEMEARLIDDLLDLTRINRGKIELHFEAVDAHATLRRALEICQADIDTRQLEVTQAMRAGNCFIWADPARVQQVFWNLINNAVKFTPHGGRISLRTRMESSDDEENTDRLVVEIADSGVGIAPDVLPRIFSAFEQGERTVTRQFGGLGLGLAISRALVKMHKNASLTAVSEGVDKGATFIVSFPVIGADRVRESQKPRSPRRKERSKLQVLLVEDHEDTLRMMSKLLKMFGYDVKAASSVEEVRVISDTARFDLVISDIGLPDGSGLDVIRHLRAQSANRGIRGIALSGFGMEDDIRNSRKAGFERHLTKPVSLDGLEETIQEVMSLEASGCSSDSV
ncbi:ATP-binding protein [Thalassoroseus pseudoceratinae]|uniref:ATP-binding protein n=1 Tax=Thalassoroseus pseudoceratinae TaxID=2713176 RepID=UPI00142073D2|nr:ATP-binding protein [Thalassoroseus pseudoceratinae]